MEKDDKQELDLDELIKKVDKNESNLIRQESSISRIIYNSYNHIIKGNDENKRNATLQSLIGYILRRHTLTVVLSIGSILIAISSLVIAYQANKIVSDQNLLLEKQNVRLDQQTYLLEAERRSSYVFLLANIYDQVNDEMSKQTGNTKSLSNEVIANISSVCQGLKPYKYLSGDSLSTYEFSPERGQILLFLSRLNLSRSTYDKIYQSVDFSFADLEGVNLSHEYFRGIELKNGNLRFCNFAYSDLSYSNLQGTNLAGSTLNEIDLTNSNLLNIDLAGAYSDENFFNTLYLSHNDIIEKLQNKRFKDINTRETTVAAGLLVLFKKFRIGGGFYEMYESEAGDKYKKVIIIRDDSHNNAAPPTG